MDPANGASSKVPSHKTALSSTSSNSCDIQALPYDLPAYYALSDFCSLMAGALYFHEPAKKTFDTLHPDHQRFFITAYQKTKNISFETAKAILLKDLRPLKTLVFFDGELLIDRIYKITTSNSTENSFQVIDNLSERVEEFQAHYEKITHDKKVSYERSIENAETVEEKEMLQSDLVQYLSSRQKLLRQFFFELTFKNKEAVYISSPSTFALVPYSDSYWKDIGELFLQHFPELLNTTNPRQPVLANIFCSRTGISFLRALAKPFREGNKVLVPYYYEHSINPIMVEIEEEVNIDPNYIDDKLEEIKEKIKGQLALEQIGTFEHLWYEVSVPLIREAFTYEAPKSNSSMITKELDFSTFLPLEKMRTPVELQSLMETSHMDRETALVFDLVLKLKYEKLSRLTNISPSLLQNNFLELLEAATLDQKNSMSLAPIGFLHVYQSIKRLSERQSLELQSNPVEYQEEDLKTEVFQSVNTKNMLLCQSLAYLKIELDNLLDIYQLERQEYLACCDSKIEEIAREVEEGLLTPKQGHTKYFAWVSLTYVPMLYSLDIYFHHIQAIQQKVLGLLDSQNRLFNETSEEKFKEGKELAQLLKNVQHLLLHTRNFFSDLSFIKEPIQKLSIFSKLADIDPQKLTSLLANKKVLDELKPSFLIVSGSSGFPLHKFYSKQTIRECNLRGIKHRRNKQYRQKNLECFSPIPFVIGAESSLPPTIDFLLERHDLPSLKEHEEQDSTLVEPSIKLATTAKSLNRLIPIIQSFIKEAENSLQRLERNIQRTLRGQEVPRRKPRANPSGSSPQAASSSSALSVASKYDSDHEDAFVDIEAEEVLERLANLYESKLQSQPKAGKRGKKGKRGKQGKNQVSKTNQLHSSENSRKLLQAQHLTESQNPKVREHLENSNHAFSAAQMFWEKSQKDSLSPKQIRSNFINFILHLGCCSENLILTIAAEPKANHNLLEIYQRLVNADKLAYDEDLLTWIEDFQKIHAILRDPHRIRKETPFRRALQQIARGNPLSEKDIKIVQNIWPRFLNFLSKLAKGPMFNSLAAKSLRDFSLEVFEKYQPSEFLLESLSTKTPSDPLIEEESDEILTDLSQKLLLKTKEAPSSHSRNTFHDYEDRKNLKHCLSMILTINQTLSREKLSDVEKNLYYREGFYWIQVFTEQILKLTAKHFSLSSSVNLQDVGFHNLTSIVDALSNICENPPRLAIIENHMHRLGILHKHKNASKGNQGDLVLKAIRQSEYPPKADSSSSSQDLSTATWNTAKKEVIELLSWILQFYVPEEEKLLEEL